ncbi:MAG: hypothetical protein K8R50_01495 [Betaproteobacteria bacterium]|nr:hypothetical protein [Betaproteobacteria bacterium]
MEVLDDYRQAEARRLHDESPTGVCDEAQPSRKWPVACWLRLEQEGRTLSAGTSSSNKIFGEVAAARGGNHAAGACVQNLFSVVVPE